MEKISRKLAILHPPKEPKREKWTPDKRYRKDFSKLFLHHKHEWSIEHIQFFAYDLLRWSEEDTSITISAWAFEYAFTLQRLEDWRKAYPCFNEAYEMVMERLGQRREEKALAGVYNAQLIAKFLPVYSSKYKEYVKWQTELSKEIEGNLNGGKQYIVLEKFGGEKSGESGNRDSASTGQIPAKKLSNTNSRRTRK